MFAGRGRGRGRGAYILNDDKKPGAGATDGTSPTSPVGSSPANQESFTPPSSPSKQNGESQLACMVKTLTVGGTDLQAVSEAAKTFAINEGKHKEAVQIIYRRCYEDWRMSPTAAKLCNKLTQEIGPEFRAVLLMVIQKDFKRKGELRQCFPSNFLGCLSFLCQVFAHMKVGDALTEPFLPLLVPVYESLEMLLDKEATDTEMECAIVQMFSVGPLLQKYGDSNKLKQLIRTVKDKILDAKCARNVKESMLELIECHASNWTLYPPKQ